MLRTLSLRRRVASRCAVVRGGAFLLLRVVQGHGKGVDWWTLGILIYEILAGQPPFVDDDPMGIYQQILAGKLSFPRCVAVSACCAVAVCHRASCCAGFSTATSRTW